MYDIIIAGAGPVGLFLACELRLAGASVLILEQAAEPATPLKRLPFGMRGLSVPSLEALYRRGLLDAVTGDPAAAQGHWLGQPRRAAGHFAGIQFHHDRIDSAHWSYRLPSPAGTSLPVTLATLEAVLAEQAAATGVEIRRGCGVEGFDQSDEAVTVRAGGQAFHARWLVGCDGGRSTVRKAGGFAFVGTDPEFTGYSVEVVLVDPTALEQGRHYTPSGVYTYARPGTIAIVDFDGGAFHRSTALTLDHVQSVLRRVTGVDVALTALHLATTWTDRAALAAAYRRGRVLLAGDAAHIHSPLGGQGLNLGLGDAMNLGWKLAATICGDAPAGLIDSYEAERRPVAARILDWSRAQVALMRPTAATRALADVMRDLIETRDGATYVAERVWGVSLRYDLGGGHPLVGRSVPDFEFSDGMTVGAHLRRGKGLLLDFAALMPWRDWGGQIVYLRGEPRDRLGLSALLVRPDGIVAWASDADPDPAEAAAAARRWFGAP